jgi:hypothetical protein
MAKVNKYARLPQMEQTNHRGRGRPRKAAPDKRSRWLGVAVTPSQKVDFSLRAQAAGITESAYLRLCIGGLESASPADPRR